MAFQQIHWKEKLKYKFQNSRRRYDKDLDVCIARKRRKQTTPGEAVLLNSPVSIQANEGGEHEHFMQEEASNISIKTDQADNTSIPSDCDQSFQSQANQQRAKIFTETRCSSDATARSSQFGLQRFLPPRSESETDDTIRTHIKTMKAECRKRDLDQQKVSTLMDLTFPDRRSFIVTSNPDVSEVLHEYPALKDIEQVII